MNITRKGKEKNEYLILTWKTQLISWPSMITISGRKLRRLISSKKKKKNKEGKRNKQNYELQL